MIVATSEENGQKDKKNSWHHDHVASQVRETFAQVAADVADISPSAASNTLLSDMQHSTRVIDSYNVSELSAPSYLKQMSITVAGMCISSCHTVTQSSGM